MLFNNILFTGYRPVLTGLYKKAKTKTKKTVVLNII